MYPLSCLFALTCASDPGLARGKGHDIGPTFSFSSVFKLHNYPCEIGFGTACREYLYTPDFTVRPTMGNFILFVISEIYGWWARKPNYQIRH